MNKKELKREYQESPRPLGVFQIRNMVSGKIFVGSSMNLDGIFNRFEFELKMGDHRNKSLQADWNEFGAEKFEFEVLERIEPLQNPGYDYRSDLKVLEDLWLEKLTPDGASSYNERKKTR